ncbi:hypothetical protein TH25_13530 [Thalassospira profundimaris]|uniref:Uncharacterized protein n=1 Tax=Thalassospira profundimaris TaxID=502049 RepID=A0A367X4N8_9PROT|nr:hypothetical protein [Thalassospira profundimaris]RCK48636.1 hypothetical protein TH25_13530 [Thalassospira profundimaris]
MPAASRLICANPRDKFSFLAAERTGFEKTTTVPGRIRDRFPQVLAKDFRIIAKLWGTERCEKCQSREFLIKKAA